MAHSSTAVRYPEYACVYLKKKVCLCDFYARVKNMREAKTAIISDNVK